MLAALRRRIRPLMRRRTKEQVAAELPPKQEQVLEVVLNPKHRKVYDTHLQRERRKVLGLVDDLQRNRFAIFRSLTLLRQLAWTRRWSTGTPASGRARSTRSWRTCRRWSPRATGRSCSASSPASSAGVRKRLDAEGCPTPTSTGAPGPAAADRRVPRGRAPVFLISLKAGGFGLNLTEADYVFVLDPWWNPAVEAQAVDRTHRIGQDKTVMVTGWSPPAPSRRR